MSDENFKVSGEAVPVSQADPGVNEMMEKLHRLAHLYGPRIGVDGVLNALINAIVGIGVAQEVPQGMMHAALVQAVESYYADPDMFIKKVETTGEIKGGPRGGDA